MSDDIIWYHEDSIDVLVGAIERKSTAINNRIG